MPLQTLPPGQHLPEHQGHRVWWCETGAAQAPSVLVIHGGPGGRTRVPPFNWFDGLPVRCIAFDQRGCGQSTPAAGLEHNTLADLVADIERLRVASGIEAWGLVAGSWGALVAVAYAAAHPQRVSGLFLRSAFLGSDGEVARFFEPWAGWLGDEGAAWLDARAASSPLSAGAASRARLGAAWQAFEQAQGRAGGLRATPGARFKPPATVPAVPGATPPSQSFGHMTGQMRERTPGQAREHMLKQTPEHMQEQTPKQAPAYPREHAPAHPTTPSAERSAERSSSPHLSPALSSPRSTGPSPAQPIDHLPDRLPNRLPDSLAVQLHYLQHHCFVRSGELDRWLSIVDAALADRPVALVHGLADEVCHAGITAALAQRWPQAALHWVADAGHDMDAPALRDALAAAARQWASRLA